LLDSADAHGRDIKMAGLVIIGLDFGMALTKCAVAIQPPSQSTMEKVVVAFQEKEQRQRFHLPSCVWTGGGSIALEALGLSDVAECQLGLKRRLLDAWAHGDQEVVPGACVTECGFFFLARVLARVRRAVVAHLERRYPGAEWTWVVNAATPASRGSMEVATPREAQMKALVARALAYVERYPDACEVVRVEQLASAIAEADRLVEREGTARRVAVLRESLAAALFALQADDAESGTWLTVDVGALTTDTSLFFFSPDQQYRIAAYYAMTSRVGGMEPVATAIAARSAVPVQLAHARIASLSASDLESAPEFGKLTTTVRNSVGDTLRAAWTTGNAFKHLFVDQPGGRECLFRFLLVGGGSCTRAMQAFLRRWQWHAFKHIPPGTVVARIPHAFGILWPDGTVDHSKHPRDSDHPILAVACGLAQQPWEMPRFQNITSMRGAGKVPRADRVEQYWWGGN
jgi:hypothetical protein